jgi:MFS family permease
MEVHADNKGRGRLDFNLAGKIVLLSGLAVPSYALAALTPILPAIAAHFSSNPHAGTLTRMVISLVGLTVAGVSPLVGALSDRVGPRRVLLASVLGFGLAGCAPFFLNNLYWILATRIVVGVASAAFGAVIVVILLHHSAGEQRNRWLGYMTTTSLLLGRAVSCNSICSMSGICLSSRIRTFPVSG